MLNILYEDNHIIVAFKPKGILSQADSSNKDDMLSLLKNYIKEKYNKPGAVYLGLVHRLDTNTSGVMVFARTSKAASRLSEAVKKHELTKKYYATVEGNLVGNNEKLISYINKDEVNRTAYIDKNGKEAILTYTDIKHYYINKIEVTDLDISLLTGRFHQIRCQMASIGHPLYGDTKYGSKNNIDKLEFPLCAYSLTFPHPTTKEMLTFTYNDKE